MKILGLDPGTAAVGWGMIETKGDGLQLLSYGCIETNKTHSMEERLCSIYRQVYDIIKKSQPHCLAVERLFFFVNLKTVMAVGEARGVIRLASGQCGVRLFEYTPPQIKLALTGYGRAKKPAVQQAVKEHLNLTRQPKPDDAADALATAITHHFKSNEFKKGERKVILTKE